MAKSGGKEHDTSSDTLLGKLGNSNTRFQFSDIEENDCKINI
jgi:hypothetical protein